MLWRALLLVSIVLIPGIVGARSIYNDLCEGKDDVVVDLPPDPRSLATNANGFTARWVSCHDEPLVETCGEWRAAVAEGKRILEEEAMIGSLLSSDTYNDLWQAWGLDSRPDQEEFEARIVQRYGLQPAPFDNPYPLPGEDPATTGGGSGQLPMGLIQTRNASGEYDGGIGLSCLACHAGRIAGESIVGLGNNTTDLQLFLQDVIEGMGVPMPVAPPVVGGATRGTVDADYGFAVLQALRDLDTLDPSPFVKSHWFAVRVGDQDPPNWWNKASRPRLLFDGGVPADNTRTFMAFLMADTSATGASIKAWEDEFEDIYTYLDSIEAPEYPGEIDTDCTDDVCVDEGKRIFHEVNLFARLGQQPPIGNGSCSSCHGIHATEYANDPTVGTLREVQPAFLSAQILPQGVVGTDPERLGGPYLGVLGQSYRWQYSTSWWSFVDNRNENGDPLMEGLNDFNTREANVIDGGRVQGECGWEQERIGYLAPPLLGIWASAPYFHNGSVPTVWQVLDPEERPEYWRRELADDPLTGSEQGFATDFDAYDTERLGWKYDVVEPTVTDPTGLGADRPVYRAGVGLLAAPTTPTGRSPKEERKIYNTHLFGKSNEGHTWTQALTDAEREALIEFLKTL